MTKRSKPVKVRSPQLLEKRKAKRLAQKENVKIDLQKVRDAAGLTQVQLAEKLVGGQASVSRLERRTDNAWSSIVRYIKACGGTLQLEVTIGDQKLIIYK